MLERGVEYFFIMINMDCVVCSQTAVSLHFQSLSGYLCVGPISLLFYVFLTVVTVQVWGFEAQRPTL